MFQSGATVQLKFTLLFQSSLTSNSLCSSQPLFLTFLHPLFQPNLNANIKFNDWI